MKKYYLFIVFLLCTIVGYGDGIIPFPTTQIQQVSDTIIIDDNKSVRRFSIYAPQSRSYYLWFWLMGVKHINGDFSSYNIMIDNNPIIDYVTTDRGDWHLYSPHNASQVYLTQGYHYISLEGTLQDIPNAERVIGNGSYFPNQLSDTLYYKRRKSHQQMNNNALYVGPSRTIDYFPYEGDSCSPPFHYNAELNKKVYYTFCRLEYYSQGQTVNYQSEVVNGLDHVLNVFSQISPESYSWSAVSNGTHASLEITIPQSGFYYVLVRSYNPAEWGTCNLTINNDRRFEDIPVNSSYTSIPLPGSRDNFTCFAISETGNPIILLMDTGNSGRVLAYNDDYPYIPTLSDYDWGTNARINGAFSQGQWIFTTSYSYPCEQRFDIYTGLWTRSALPYFPNMKDDDTICSSFPYGDYNCISWAMGEWLVGYWLGYFNEVSESGVWYEDALDSLFNAYGYTRENATASNSMVDLWKGISPQDGYMKCTHASIKSKANQYAAGYDWESKIGGEIRIFHPRYALEGGGYAYGEVFAHYIKDIIVPYPGHLTPVLLNASLNQEEINTIKEGVTNVPRGALNEFDALYDECKKNGSLSVSISIDEFEGVEPYHDLLLICKNVPVLRYLLYERICSQDILAMKLLKDLTLVGNRGIWEKVREQTLAIKKEHSSINAVMPIQTKALLLVKALLTSEENESSSESKDAITYSTDPVVDVICMGNQLTISYQLHTDANVSLKIGTVDGSFITPLINKKQQEAGKHHVSYTISKPGIYTIGLITNGCVYKKKITVK